MFDKKDILNATINSQHCQRNWDLTKSIPESDIIYFIEILSSSPLKQNINYFDIHIISSRTIIKQIYNTSIFDDKLIDEDGDIYTLNPQTYANLLIILSFNKLVFDNNSYKDRNYHIKNYRKDELQDLQIADEFNKQFVLSSGLALGQVSLVANLLGYRTGFCSCFQVEPIKKILNTSVNLYSPILGIGYNTHNRRNKDHFSEKEFQLYERFKPNIRYYKN